MHHEHADIFKRNLSEGGGDFDHLKIIMYLHCNAAAGNEFGLLDVKLTLFRPL